MYLSRRELYALIALIIGSCVAVGLFLLLTGCQIQIPLRPEQEQTK